MLLQLWSDAIVAIRCVAVIAIQHLAQRHRLQKLPVIVIQEPELSVGKGSFDNSSFP